MDPEKDETTAQRQAEDEPAKGADEGRDIEARDKQIAELQAQLEERSKTEEGRAALEEGLDKLKADMVDERTDHKLQLRAASTRRRPRRCSATTAATWRSSRRAAPICSRPRSRPAPRASV